MGGLIVVEAMDGGGKTTMVEVVRDYLVTTSQVEVIMVREPGGTPIAETIRAIHKGNHNEAMSPITELLLLEAARAQLVQSVIRPALAAGKWVVADRFTLSTHAYQGSLPGISYQTVAALNELATGGLVPDLTIYLDVEADVGLARSPTAGHADRIEARGRDYFQRVLAMYRSALSMLEMFSSEQEVVIIDANQSLDAVKQAVYQALINWNYGSN